MFASGSFALIVIPSASEAIRVTISATPVAVIGPALADGTGSRRELRLVTGS
jgi:hypothetical protein